MFPRQSPPTEKDPPFSLICQKLSQRLVLLGRVMKALFSLSLQGSRVFVSIGGYLGCLRLGCSYSHKAGQPELGNPDGTSHTAHEFQVVLLIADKSSDHISGCSFILSREEGVGADTCCGHSNWALDLLLFQLEENALLHAWSLLQTWWGMGIQASPLHLFFTLSPQSLCPQLCSFWLCRWLLQGFGWPSCLPIAPKPCGAPSHCWSCRNWL